MTDNILKSKSILLIQLLTFSVFIGRAYQFIFFDIPYRSLFWDENLMTPLVEYFGLSWNQYINNLEIAQNQELIIQIIGFFLLGLAVLSMFSHYKKRWINRLLLIGAVILFTLSLLYWKEHFYYVGQLIEYTIQWTTPIGLVFFINKTLKHNSQIVFIKTVIALTFIGHGFYAFGFYPVPGNFVQMCLDAFPFSEIQAIHFLKIIGGLDFLAAILLFTPKTVKVALWYCIIWGFLTAFARVVANFDILIPWLSLQQWLWETIVRLPHGGIPLFLLWVISKDD